MFEPIQPHEWLPIVALAVSAASAAFNAVIYFKMRKDDLD